MVGEIVAVLLWATLSQEEPGKLEGPVEAKSAETTDATPPAPRAPVLGPLPTPAYIDMMNRNWRGVGLGIDMGYWGSGFQQGIKIDVPFGWRVGQFVGLRVRGMVVHSGPQLPYDPIINSGFELFGRGPVLLGIIRLYGGAGVWVGVRPVPSDNSRVWGVAGGGHFGIEGRLSDRASLTFEVGGQGPAHALSLDSGASVVGGVVTYFGNLKRKKNKSGEN